MYIYILTSYNDYCTLVYTIYCNYWKTSASVHFNISCMRVTLQLSLYLFGVIPYMYKFSRDVIFGVFAVNWPSAKFSFSKFHWLTLTCMNQRAGYLVILENKIAKMLDLWHPRNLHASKICTYTVNPFITVYSY